METKDAYDQAVEYLTEHPKEIMYAWNYAMGACQGPGSCLFGAASKDRDNDECGCLTMVRSGERDAQSWALSKAIREDDRLPYGGGGITPAHLPIFAEWQRRLDKELGRTPPALDPRIPS